MNEDFISRQIAVYKNNRVLLEFLDKLKAASLTSYAHIHADGEPSDNGYKRTSLIGLLLKDYSKGTGDNAVTVTANISPEEAKFILSRLTAGFSEVKFSREKIFGAPDPNGYSQVTKLLILRNPVDQHGKATDKPWRIALENGSGIPQTNANGGTYMQANSYRRRASAQIFLSDEDLFKLLARVSSYIDAWEKAVGPSLIMQARNAMSQQAHQNHAA